MKRIFLIIITSILIFSIFAGCNNQIFDGNRSGNDAQFIMDYSVLNKTEVHEMKLEEGTLINVNIVNNAGRLDILIVSISGSEIYRGDNVNSGQFKVEIPQTDTYKFVVKGIKAEGSVSFKVED